VYQLKRDFPNLVVVINGGVTDSPQVLHHLSSVDGVMIGRAAYDSPWFLTQWDSIVQQALHSPSFSSASSTSSQALKHPFSLDADSVEDAMVVYMQQQMAGRPPPFHWRSVARHMLGLRNGQVSTAYRFESSFTQCNTVTL
jgi:tRNA-dihydrouridine synthase A